VWQNTQIFHITVGGTLALNCTKKKLLTGKINSDLILKFLVHWNIPWVLFSGILDSLPYVITYWPNSNLHYVHSPKSTVETLQFLIAKSSFLKNQVLWDVWPCRLQMKATRFSKTSVCIEWLVKCNISTRSKVHKLRAQKTKSPIS